MDSEQEKKSETVPPLSQDDEMCLSSLGISAQSHDSYEQDIMGRIARKLEEKEKAEKIERSKKQLLALIAELKLIIQRRQMKERELKKMYSSGNSGLKRKVESLLLDQEKLNNRIEELDRNQTKLLDELKRCGYDVTGDPLINPIDTNLNLQDEPEVKQVIQEEPSETATERDVRLGALTAFGSTLQTTSQFEPQAKIDIYMQNQLSTRNLPTASQKSTHGNQKLSKLTKKGEKRKRKPPKVPKKKRKMDDSDDSGSDYNPGTESGCSEREAEGEEEEEGEEAWLTDSDEETSKKIRKAKDDGDKELYIARLLKWEKTRNSEEKELDGKFEKLKEGLKIPTILWNKLFNYQRVAVQWMFELHQQRVGGLLGDEMGLGKTVQVIAFLASLSYTKSSDTNKAAGLGATIIVCPTTVLSQWVSELHKWWPPFRVGILHSSGSFVGSRSSLIRSINSCRGILVMSYQAVATHMDVLSNLQWEYIILDEGHKIRNPDAKITLAVKQIATPHRLILSGSPLQNNLKELWSLFDFIYPGKLGTLPTFIQQFSGPITQGGYSNASEVQVATAFRCATVLKDTINPYLLRRMKADVKQHINLPEKNEQVLFCKLTDEQRFLYRSYIESKDTKSILDGRMKVFVGLIALRKICNHPDLFFHDKEDLDEGSQEEQFGWYKRSGKMLVIHSLLRIWRKQGHRVLLFTQSRQMLRVLETYAKSQNYSYLRLDGTTPVGSRQSLIDRFNNNDDIFLFILTTRVGGLGVNLTGADRIVIFDPDWNPSTDMQARERAWRIGQERQVTIYRLMTSGTIEEKIYHRQIYKQFLVNRVLKDPKQRRFFKSNDLHELFTLNETDNNKTETSAIFAGTGSNIKVTPPPSFKPKKRKSTAASGGDVKSSLSRLYQEEGAHTQQTRKEGLSESELSDEKRRELREKAKRISANFSKSKPPSQQPTSSKQQQPTSSVQQPSSSQQHQTSSQQQQDSSLQQPTSSQQKPNSTVEQQIIQAQQQTETQNLHPDNRLGQSEHQVKEEEPKSDLEPGEISDEPSSSPSLHLSQLASVHSTQISGPSSSSSPNPFQLTGSSTPASPHPLQSAGPSRTGSPYLLQSAGSSENASPHAGAGPSTPASRHPTQSPGPSRTGSPKLETPATSSSKHKRKKHKKDRGERGGRFEGERVSHLVKAREYVPPLQDEEEEEKTAQSQDNYVLARLFAKSGVHSAVQHDAIIEDRTSDYAIIESEANKVASEAIKALRASRQECLRAESGVPNWTGQNGRMKKRFAGKKIKSGTLSSGDLLARMKNRNLVSSTVQRPEDNEGSLFFPSGAGSSGRSSAVNQADLDLLTDIRNFVAFQGRVDGEASTSELVSKFQKALPSQKSPLFKAFLKQICDLRREEGRGIWSIKAEFR